MRREVAEEPRWYQEREPAILQQDITELPTKRILEAAGLQVGEATPVCARFPRHGFSTSNYGRHLDDPRNKLINEFTLVARQASPVSLVFQNVPGMVWMAKGALVREFRKDLAECGLMANWRGR